MHSVMRAWFLFLALISCIGSLRHQYARAVGSPVGSAFISHFPSEFNRSFREVNSREGLDDSERLRLLLFALDPSLRQQPVQALSSPLARSRLKAVVHQKIARISRNPSQQPVRVSGYKTRRTSSPRLALAKQGRSTNEILFLTRLTWPDWPWIIGAFVSLTFAAVGEASLPALQAGALNAALHLDPKSSLRSALLRLGTVGLVTSIFTGLRGFLFWMCGARLVARLRSKVFTALLNQPQAFHDNQGPGELSARLSADCLLLGDALSLNVNIVFRELLQTILSVAFVMGMNVRLGGLVLAGVALRLCFLYFYSKAYRRVAKELQDSLAVSSGVAEQCISLIKLVRSHGNEAHESNRYDNKMKHILTIEKRQGSLYAGSRIFQTSLDVVTLLIVLALGSALVSTGYLPADSLTTLLLYVGFISSSSNDVADNWSDIQEALGASTKVFDYIRSSDASKTQTKANTLRSSSEELEHQVGSQSDRKGKRGALNFRSVDFSYPSRNTTQVLQNFSLSVKPGERVAIVGGSGSGKSTIFALALHFYDPTSGSVTLDKIPMDQINRSILSSSVAWVQQEPPLFPNVTIAANIAYGLQNVTSEQIERAAREANAWEFIESLPEKLETRIGGFGASLSGGQKQRIAIARALVRDPSVLLLDEATSALDPESERLVNAAIDRASKGRTLLYATHKVAQAKSADHIIVMANGRIVEEGTHSDLLREDGAYAGLLRAGSGVSEEQAAFIIEEGVSDDENHIADQFVDR